MEKPLWTASKNNLCYSGSPKDTVTEQHKNGANINTDEQILFLLEFKEGTERSYRQIYIIKDYLHPCLCTHSSQNCSGASSIHSLLAQSIPLRETHPDCSKTLWDKKSFPSGSGTRRCCMEAQSHCSCQWQQWLSENGRICSTAGKQAKNNAGPGCLQSYLPHINF